MRRYRWTRLEPDQKVVEALAKDINVSHPVARALCNRGVTGFDEARTFFRPDLSLLPSPFLFGDMEKAVRRLGAAVEGGEKIMIYGDYDVDGTTGTALLYLFLRERGAEVSFYINDRFAEGYGLSAEGVAHAVGMQAGLVITVDCGIRANDEIGELASRGIDVIVCDHHEPNELPPALAILDPKVSACGYPFRELCGCAVALKLLHAFSESAGLDQQAWSRYLDLVALATAADMVPLEQENRVYTHAGLEIMRNDSRPGIREMLSIAGIRAETLSVAHIAFGIAPRINAAGRMHTARTAVDWLIADSGDEARVHAAELDRLNSERREIDAGIFKSADTMAEGYFASYCSSLVLFSEEWHLGVLGIVASRLQEKYYLPTVVMGSRNGLIKGSVRSVAGLNVFEVLQQCERFLDEFGGHDAAAGVTLRPENIAGFRREFDRICSERLSVDQRQKELLIDSPLSLGEVTGNFLNVLGQFGPFGLGNREPLFLSSGLRLSGLPRLLKGKHVKFAVRDVQGGIYDVIAFGREDIYRALERGSRKPFSIVYSLEENEWNGRKSLQLKLKDMAFEEG
ncbi:single-stranded-DNA-specific exonuclease RecJ [Prosthecochloris sp. GSB1]|uniref:single-stranded-DNA-specific exonuclease RecJ n=1 Tax=Prosthecochloris sp. GSB1 TaxID=281093 RepID=UPI000B8CDCA2|nr:single-stranded-DNA-specific exonuclease RecJ [Prosthecochloris sp. GSB1]ASQ91714.1 single-stranded-DNA-specific exonuclease RecJ [Prosthecochloris sp. GSB1]